MDVQGTADNSGAFVSVAGRRAITGPTGEYGVSGVPAGTHPVKINRPGYLEVSRQVEVLAGKTTVLPDVALLCCDLDGGGRITVFELAVIGHNLGLTGVWDGPEEFVEGEIPGERGPQQGSPEEQLKLGLLRDLQSLKSTLRNEGHIRMVDELMIKVDAMLEIESVELETKHLAIRQVEGLIRRLEDHQPGASDPNIEILEEVLHWLNVLVRIELAESGGPDVPPDLTEPDIKYLILDLLDSIAETVSSEFPFKGQLFGIRDKVAILLELERIEAKVKFLAMFEARQLLGSLELVPEGDASARVKRIIGSIQKLIEIERLDGPPYPEFLDRGVEVLGAEGIVSVTDLASGQTETVELMGDTVVQRHAPYQDESGGTVIDVEIVSMDLRGASPTMGDLRLHEKPMDVSSGSIVFPTEDFSFGESFFDIFVRVELGEAMAEDVFSMNGGTQGPMLAGSSHFAFNSVVLYDKDGNPLAELSGLSFFLEETERPVPLPEEEIKIIVMDLLDEVADSTTRLPSRLLDDLVLKFDTMAELEKVAEPYKWLIWFELNDLAHGGEGQLLQALQPAIDATWRILEIEDTAHPREPESSHLMRVIAESLRGLLNRAEELPYEDSPDAFLAALGNPVIIDFDTFPNGDPTPTGFNDDGSIAEPPLSGTEWAPMGAIFISPNGQELRTASTIDDLNLYQSFPTPSGRELLPSSVPPVPKTPTTTTWSSWSILLGKRLAYSSSTTGTPTPARCCPSVTKTTWSSWRFSLSQSADPTITSSWVCCPRAGPSRRWSW